MFTCNCTLVGTKACENCEDISIFASPWRSNVAFVCNTPILGYTEYKVYNPEIHELVEKKNTKISRIKEEISNLEKEVKFGDYWVKYYKSNIERENLIISKKEDRIKKLKQELKELE